jgi:hypothetical protein
MAQRNFQVFSECQRKNSLLVLVLTPPAHRSCIKPVGANYFSLDAATMVIVVFMCMRIMSCEWLQIFGKLHCASNSVFKAPVLKVETVDLPTEKRISRVRV